MIWLSLTSFVQYHLANNVCDASFSAAFIILEKKTLGDKELFENRQKMTKQTDSNGQYECGHVLAPCLRGSSFSIHIPGRKVQPVQHGLKIINQGRIISRPVEENNESQLHCKKKSGYHIIYDIIYIYISIYIYIYHIKKQYLSVSFEYRVISYCIVDSVLRNFLCL